MSVETQSAVNENEQIAQRKLKLAAWRATGKAYPTAFHRDTWMADLVTQYAEWDTEQLAAAKKIVVIAGRMITRRLMGKASFIHMQEGSLRMQVYIAQDQLPEGQYETFKSWDLGDIVGITGEVFRTKTGELSVKAHDLLLLTKALRPMPDKFHGLSDQEQRYRQRYVDLIANPDTRQVFEARSKIVSGIRRFLEERRFLEVETPMMHTLAGGAAARPFETYHNTLDMPLFLRIAPELYLKRLVVGGFDRVFEINRNFRNEGISTRHNPEFTMLEFYQAYATYEDLMDLTEVMFRELAIQVAGQAQVIYQGETLDFGQPFARLTMAEAITQHHPNITLAALQDLESIRSIAQSWSIPHAETLSLGQLVAALFEKGVERQLRSPTFITAFPVEISPLARMSDHNPAVTDRFELYVAGQEIANGFSELNDPEDQAARFRAQIEAKRQGDEEAMPYDTDYITALEYGLPPTAGEGIGIDRLTMLLTDSASIRDVILFPLMRPIEGN